MRQIMSTLTGIAIGLVIVGLASPAAISQDPEPDVLRFQRVFDRDAAASATCLSDVCGGDPAAPFAISLPAELGPADLTVTLTIEYRATADDTPLVSMKIRDGAWTRLAPGLLALRRGGPETTTLTWVDRNVQPGDYTLQWAFDPDRMTFPFAVRVHSAVLVVEAVPS
jgi:hypothetical protein